MDKHSEFDNLATSMSNDLEVDKLKAYNTIGIIIC
jgi:hypothetical protein